MRILAIVSGKYGRRHVKNITAHCPADWVIETWQAPAGLPLILDYPEEFLPESLPATDLLLSFGEATGVAELVPDIVKMTGAQAVIAPIDSDAWLPRGLARQLIGWLERMDVGCVTPKPLCSLDVNEYWLARGEKVTYDIPLIAEFVKYFGKPIFDVKVDEESRTVSSVEVTRDAFCGCARFVAERLVGVDVDEAEEKAGLLHHNYPCMATMIKDPTYNKDTLMHVSGHIFRDNISPQIRAYRNIPTITPGKKAD
jgi:thymidylate synthase